MCEWESVAERVGEEVGSRKYSLFSVYLCCTSCCLSKLYIFAWTYLSSQNLGLYSILVTNHIYLFFYPSSSETRIEPPTSNPSSATKATLLSHYHNITFLSIGAPLLSADSVTDGRALTRFIINALWCGSLDAELASASMYLLHPGGIPMGEWIWMIFSLGGCFSHVKRTSQIL